MTGAGDHVFWLTSRAAGISALVLASVVHTLGAGTDAGQPWLLALTAVVVLPPLVLLGARWRSRMELAPRVAASHSSPT